MDTLTDSNNANKLELNYASNIPSNPINTVNGINICGYTLSI